MGRLKIIVGGYIGLFPTGGATWDYIQYPLGFHLLGHDVYYLEDTHQYPVYQKDPALWNDSTATVRYIRASMEGVGLDGRWAYRDTGTGKWIGMSEHAIAELFATADVFLNLSSATHLRPEYFRIPVRILLDSDPMFTQVALIKQRFTNKQAWEDFFSYTHHFSFGLNIGQPDSRIPTLGINWLTTCQPICHAYWEGMAKAPAQVRFSSIMNWTERPPFEYDGECWGQKNIVFQQYENLPGYFPEGTLELVVNTSDFPDARTAMKALTAKGWGILDPHRHVENMEKYRRYIQKAGAEFSVTKQTYIKSKSGWFSGRSACYLAAGKPVVTQDTGWTKYLPSGTGLLACNNIEEARQAIGAVIGNYAAHSAKALELSRTYFDSKLVLSEMLRQVGY